MTSAINWMSYYINNMLELKGRIEIIIIWFWPALTWPQVEKEALGCREASVVRHILYQQGWEWQICPCSDLYQSEKSNEKRKSESKVDQPSKRKDKNYYINVMCMSVSKFLTWVPIRWTRLFLFFSACWIAWIKVETVERVFSSKRLNSSKHPQAPLLANPMNMRPMDFTSNPFKIKRVDIMKHYIPRHLDVIQSFLIPTSMLFYLLWTSTLCLIIFI